MKIYLLSILLLLPLVAEPFRQIEPLPPNIVLIISDDHGWRDYGFMGHPQIRTPHLDRLAAQSLVFPRGYVPTSLCSPSLASIITGLYPHQHMITGNDPPAPPGGKQGDWRNHPQYIADWGEMRSSIKRLMLHWPGRVKPRKSENLASSLNRSNSIASRSTPMNGTIWPAGNQGVWPPSGAN